MQIDSALQQKIPRKHSHEMHHYQAPHPIQDLEIHEYDHWYGVIIAHINPVLATSVNQETDKAQESEEDLLESS